MAPGIVTAERGSPFRALAVVSYRWFALAQVLGNGAMWMHRTAHVWLVVQISGGDGVAVGVVTGLQYISMILLGLSGGALGDRFDKRRIMLMTQSVVVLASVVLAVLIAGDAVTLPIAYLFAVLLGVPGALDAPVRLAYPRQLVPYRFLAAAVGLNGAVFQLARVAGPALAGGVIAFSGTAAVFAVVALFGLVSCLALVRVRPLPGGEKAEAEEPAGGRRGLADLRAPAYLVPLLGGLMLGIGMTHLQLAIPLLVDSTEKDAAGSFGALTAMIGAGGIVGAGLAASLRSEPTNRILLAWSAVFAAVTVLVSTLPSGLILAAGLFVAGVTMQVFGTSAVSALQLRSPANVQGRMMALYVIAFFVWVPVGAPIFGWFANLVGARQALGVSGLVCLAVVGLLALSFLTGRAVTREQHRE
ncbi:MFS transporter [Streptosporangium sp. NPDC006013]|uniref:MFS transporter n=1 Tax=Streptosporangium sp. NPDC006013 TaxID=3155596 RepID=UPI0033B480E3